MKLGLACHQAAFARATFLPAHGARCRNLRNSKPFNSPQAILLLRRHRDMPTLSSGLLRAGLALKLSQIKLATRSYLRDRTNQATGTVTSYAIGAGLFAAAGVFLIAACLVGAAALFRWIEVKYGLFFAFGAVGALLLVLAAICAALAVSSIKRPPPQFPSLTSRLRVAIRANPSPIRSPTNFRLRGIQHPRTWFRPHQ